MTAFDYQVLAFQDAAPLRQVGIYGKNPLTLDIRGRTFVGVASVKINGVDSPEFIVVSPTRILAQVPDQEVKSALRTVRVLLSREGLTPSANVDLLSTVPGARASGFTKLMQAYLRVLFTNPGEDLAFPWLGAGLGKLVGAAGTSGELRAAAVSAVATAEQHLLRLQVKNSLLTDSERLRSASLLKAEYSVQTTSVAVRVTLTAMDGTTGNPHLSL